MLVLRLDLQPNIRERNPVVKRDPTVYVFGRNFFACYYESVGGRTL